MPLECCSLCDHWPLKRGRWEAWTLQGPHRCACLCARSGVRIQPRVAPPPAPSSAEPEGFKRAACPRPAICGPGGQGPPTGPGSSMHSVLQVAGLAHAARTHRPKGVHHLLVLPVSRQLGTRHWTLARLRLGPAQPVSQFQLDIRVARHLGGGGSWEQGTGRRHGSGSEPGRRSMSRSRATELPPPRAIPRARRLGYQVEIGRPAELARLGPVSCCRNGMYTLNYRYEWQNRISAFSLINTR